jgi:BlaI family transcriptional regulator, penicillinase repressor
LSESIRPSDLELQVLTVLWDRGPSAVRDILEAIPDRKPRAYTTVLTIMQVMERKGLVDHTRRGLAHVYRPKVRRRQVVRPLMRRMVRDLFGGRPAAAMQYLLSETDVDEQDLAAIRRMIDEHQARNDAEGEKR